MQLPDDRSCARPRACTSAGRALAVGAIGAVVAVAACSDVSAPTAPALRPTAPTVAATANPVSADITTRDPLPPTNGPITDPCKTNPARCLILLPRPRHLRWYYTVNGHSPMTTVIGPTSPGPALAPGSLMVLVDASEFTDLSDIAIYDVRLEGVCTGVYNGKAVADIWTTLAQMPAPTSSVEASFKFGTAKSLSNGSVLALAYDAPTAAKMYGQTCVITKDPLPVNVLGVIKPTSLRIDVLYSTSGLPGYPAFNYKPETFRFRF